MSSLLLAGLLLCFHASAAFTASSNFTLCQTLTSEGFPLDGCPANTIYVPANGSIQSTIESLPEDTSAIILIAAGEYHETINVTRVGPLVLLGQLSDSSSKNLVTVWDDKYVITGMDDADSAVLTVAPSRAAALIGAGPTGAPLQELPGNLDFKAYNINWENRAANYAISQALVTDISYSNASFYGCSFASYQDTWYTGRNASTYVVDSVIYGQTDYLFGFGTAWFQNVTLANRACGGGIVAWKGTNLTDAPGNRYGAYISDSTIIRSPDANASLDLDGDCYLGRPWNDLAVTVFLRTYMDETVNPKGWTPFNAGRPVIYNTTYYAEYMSSGPGGNTSARVAPSHVLKDEANFTFEEVFNGRPEWIDYTYVAGS